MSRRTSEAPWRLVDANIFLFGKDAKATKLLGIVNSCPVPDPTYRNFGTLVTDKKIFNNVDDSANYNFACSARFPSSDSSYLTDITYQSVACLAYTNTNINNNYASYINWDIDWPLYGTTFGCFYAGPANKGHSWC